MTQDSPTERSGIPLLILATITLCVGWVQFRFGNTPYLAYDEAWHIYLGKIAPPWKNLLAISNDSHPPMYYLLLRPFFLLGRDPIYPRLLGIGATILTVPLFYALLRKLRIAVPVALASTIVLASSVSFLHLGVTIRQYSLANFILLAAIWFWASMLPVNAGRPKRWHAVASLLLFSFAFSILYGMLFVSAAVFGSMLAIMVINKDAREVLFRNWRDHSGWLVWTLFALAHLAVLLWHYVGWIAHINASTPNHVNEFTPTEGQSAVDFLSTALHNEMALFTPLYDMNSIFIDAGLVAIAAVIAWLVIHNLRRENYLRATLALTPLALVVILATMALTDHYPFGGNMRHQYLLFPFLLLLIPLALDAIWHRLPNIGVKTLILVLLLVIAAHNTGRTLKHFGISEKTHSAPWQESHRELFATASDVPILIPAYALFWTYTDRFIAHGKYAMPYRNAYEPGPRGFQFSHQGWLSILMSWPSYEEYGILAEDGKEGVLIKDSYRWLFDALPDDLFYDQTVAMIEAINAKGVRIFSPLTDNAAADEEELRASVKQHGFTLTEFIQFDDSVIWTIMLDTAETSAETVQAKTPAAEPAVIKSKPVTDLESDAASTAK